MDANDLYGWLISQNLLTGEFRWVENPDEFHIRNLAQESGKDYLLEVYVSYTDISQNLYNDLSFVCEMMKIHGVQKLVPNLYDKKKYVIHIAAFNQAIKHWLVLQKIH